MSIVMRGFAVQPVGIGTVTVIGDPMTVALEAAELTADLAPAAFSVALGAANLGVALLPAAFSVTISPADLTVTLNDSTLEADLG
jgi:hypothetical protein